MVTFKNWLLEQETNLQDPTHSTTFTSPNRNFEDPSAANIMLNKQWTAYRQAQVQQGKAAHDLSIFNNYAQIKSLIGAIDKYNYRHSRIISMLNRGIREDVNAKTTIMPIKSTLISQGGQNLYQLEKDLISVQKQTLNNEHALRDIMRRQGIDMHKHIRRAAGFKGVAENDQTMDYPMVNGGQNTNSIQLGLDGPKFFQNIGQLSNEISRIAAQTEQTKEMINSLFDRTGGRPTPYQPDPQNVLD